MTKIHLLKKWQQQQLVVPSAEKPAETNRRKPADTKEKRENKGGVKPIFVVESIETNIFLSICHN